MSYPAKTWVFEWHRRERNTVLWPLTTGAMLLVCGCICGSLSIVLRFTGDWLHSGFAVLGGVLTVSGPVTALVWLRAIFKRDHYFALQSNGIYIRNGTRSRLVAWEDVAQVHYEISIQALTLELASGELLLLDEKVDPEFAQHLRRRIQHLRTKMLFFGS